MRRQRICSDECREDRARRKAKRHAQSSLGSRIVKLEKLIAKLKEPGLDGESYADRVMDDLEHDEEPRNDQT